MTLAYLSSIETQREILSCLTIGQLLVVGARCFGGMTHREIAVVLGVSPVTVSNWLAKAQASVLKQMPELEQEASQRRIRTNARAELEPWEWLRCSIE